MKTLKKDCSRCGKRPAREGKKSCEPCAIAFCQYEAEKKQRIQQGICRKCGILQTEAGFRQCIECRIAQAKRMANWRGEHPEYNADYLKIWNNKRRQLVIRHYGGKCACCAECTFEFLAVDHLNGGGDQHRREIGRGSNIVNWIIANDFPPLFRILCHNCNQAIGYYGKCPHEQSITLASVK